MAERLRHLFVTTVNEPIPGNDVWRILEGNISEGQP